MNCCDVGIPSPHTAGQVAKHKEVPTGVPVYLPTGVINPIPMTKQVLTNPVPTPLNPISFFSGKIKSSFGRLFKKKKDKTNKIPTSAADSMGGRKSQRGKDNKIIQTRGKKRIFDNERGGSLEESYFINNHPLERDDIQGQLGPADCAITCFHRVLSDLGIESSMRDMAAAMNYDPVAGCNIFKIPDAINSLGIENVNAEAGPLNTNELQKHLSSGKKAIVSVNNQQGAHAIIVDDISNGKVTIRDPLPVGRGSAYQIPVSEFEAAWLRNGAGKAVILGQ